MKEILLHVGFHKTATSSIQTTCHRNKSRIAEQGIHYPIFELNSRKIDNHSIPFHSMFSPNPSKYHINIRWGIQDKADTINKIYFEQLDQILDTQEKILISGEGISTLPPESLINMRNYFERKNFKVRVICSVRKPYSFMCSSLQQLVKGGTHTLEYLTVPKKSKDVRKLKSVFNENIIFTSFESDCKNIIGPVAVFFQRIGIDHNQLDIINIGEGVGNIATRLYAHINKKFPILKDGKLNQNGRTRLNLKLDNHKFLLNENELKLAKKELDAENEEMNSLLGAAFCDAEYKTSNNINISQEFAAKILNKMSQPSYTITSVLEFVKEHSDGTWNVSDLLCSMLITSQSKNLSSKTVDLLRDTAISFEKNNSMVAFELMELAHQARPEGPSIKKKLEEYKKNLFATSDPHTK